MEFPLEKSAGLLYPRLIALITTLNEDGSVNAAPFSWVMPISYEKPMALFAVRRENKGTLLNVRVKKEFVINIVAEDFGQAAIMCEKKSKKKLLDSGLKTVKSEAIETPGILESPIRLECRLKGLFDIPDSDHLLVTGEIVHADCASVKDSRPDWEAIKPLLHLSGEWFASKGKNITLRRFK